MRNAKLYSFSLPVDAGVVLRYQRLKTRDGFLVCLEQNGKQGWGEISPLPEFSRETLEQAQEATQSWLTAWCTGENPEHSELPSVAFGLSCALAELEGTLPLEANYRVAPLCNGDPDDLILSLNDMEGEKVAKIKVGLYEAVRDGIVVNLLLEAIPDLKLRLDANRSWTPVKAEGFAKYVNPTWRDRIAFLEEPCKTPEESLAFSQATGINIAWDETVRDDGFEIKPQPGVTTIVIKPTLVGSLERCRSLVEQAHALGLDAIISSSIESSFGLTQLARIAQWLTPNSIPGLDTVDLIKQQLIRPWPDVDIPLISLEQLETVWQQ
ncbi:o-succinylbenzoate synthase [Proteus vulgaris]|jgi:O-succinylbenzoate synthase|uniref:o-succinylbenzoate synthase n=1 Tax=Proteus TaxID=583 RepID=UPI000C9F8807|nr:MULTISPECIES: o-succinylbenzoate synthase [Proteus]MBG5969769.1 o-succinylbenzoate synthase [Proteus vulgaris]MBG5985569.1 o-succinylbenzoate synthase [Proteus vulgaris]MBW3473636.1 o-succinylbenzoate synthase [Proteus vulgaris]MCH4256507.1 o-succinylbenzoate synthase [Proteus vulgaris]MDM3558590.1 o-succinylbenzoate synthase [Proteus vulgaris]